MVKQMQSKFEEAGKIELLRSEGLELCVDKKEKEKQRKNVFEFLSKYNKNEVLIAKCKESIKIRKFFFKKDDYYLITFPEALKTYEEVPFIMHHPKVLRDKNGTMPFQSKSDVFIIKNEYLLRVFEVMGSIGKIDYSYNEASINKIEIYNFRK